MATGRLAAIALMVWACTLLWSCTNDGRAGSGPGRVGAGIGISVVDTHIDAPTELLARWADLGEAASDREFDYPRARKGGLDVAFMSIYTSAEDAAEGRARQVAHNQIDAVEALVARHPDRFAFLRSPREVPSIRKSGKIMLPMGMENAAPIGRDTAMLEVFFERGVRYLILAHSVSNEYADSSYDPNRRWHGLSPLGRDLVKEMNRLGMMVDISHLSDESAAAAIALSRASVIAGHTAMRHFTPGFERNISDELAKAVAAKGGVIQIAFGTNFIDARGAKNMQASYQARNAFDARNRERVAEGLPPRDREVFQARWEREHPQVRTGLDTLVDHIDYAVRLVGVDHVGLGSDFDGVGHRLPEGMKSVADYPKLSRALEQRGYDHESIAKIMGGNLLRVWTDVETAAETHAR